MRSTLNPFFYTLPFIFISAFLAVDPIEQKMLFVMFFLFSLMIIGTKLKQNRDNRYRQEVRQAGDAIDAFLQDYVNLEEPISSYFFLEHENGKVTLMNGGETMKPLDQDWQTLFDARVQINKKPLREVEIHIVKSFFHVQPDGLSAHEKIKRRVELFGVS